MTAAFPTAAVARIGACSETGKRGRVESFLNWVGLRLAAHQRRSRSPQRSVPNGEHSQESRRGSRRAPGRELEFLPAALEIIETPPTPARYALLGVSCVLFFATLAWLCLATLEIHAVAQGKIQPSGLSKVVQSAEAGRVAAIRVVNGMVVGAGDVLIELDPTEAIADRTVISRDLESVEAEIAARTRAIAWAREAGTGAAALSANSANGREQRLLASEIELHIATLESLDSQRLEAEARRARLQASIVARRRLLAVLNERVEAREHLDRQGLGYRGKVIDALQEYERESTQLAGEQGQLEESQAALASLVTKRREATAHFVAEQNRSLLEGMRKRDRLSQELVKAESRGERTLLKAPIAGTVQQLGVTTPGQVVAAGQALLTLVPLEAEIEVEALILNKDIGFVEQGQSAVVKIDAFPFTRFGTISGRLVRVSRDAVDERNTSASTDAQTAQHLATADTRNAGVRNLVFPVTVALESKHIRINHNEIPLVPGMAVTVEVVTGKRRAIDYLLSPVREITGASGHER